MELIYSLRRKPLKCEPPQLECLSDPDTIQPLVTISSGNIIAFSSYTDLTDTEGDSWGGHVYVCDLDTPWDTHKVICTTHPVSALEWDELGKQLLVATNSGEVFVMVMKDFLLNQWVVSYSATFPGEQIVKAIFFHNGRRILMSDKKEVPITERFQQLRHTPTLKGFGGVGAEGVCVITGSSLICAVLPKAEGICVLKECVRPSRHKLLVASIAHNNGNLLASMVCADTKFVHSVVVSVRKRALTVQPLPSLRIQAGNKMPAITWCVKDDTDYLLVAGLKLSLWQLQDRAHPVHKYLLKSTPSAAPGAPKLQEYNTVEWCEISSWSEALPRATLCAARGGRACAVLAAANTLHALARDTLLPMSSVTLCHAPIEIIEGSPPKKYKYSQSASQTAQISSMSISYLSSVLAVIDSHCQLYVYTMPQPESPAGGIVQYATSMLEYSLVTGYDCLDVLLTLKPKAVEAVVERLTETFQRQPQAFQQYYYHRWITIRAALYRMCPNGQGSASDLMSLLSVRAVVNTLEAAFRPTEGDTDALAVILDEMHSGLDIDKALLSIDLKEFACDTTTLQSLRRFIQRTCDTAIALLAAVPQPRSATYELCTDPVALGLLRRALLLIRVWGLIRPQALPSFSRSADNIDAIFRPLATLHALKGAGVPSDLIEECSMLVSAASALRIWESYPRCCISAPHGRERPLPLEYGSEPESLKYVPDPPLALENAPAYPMDSIRYMYLGGARAPRYRACGRCGALTLHKHHALCRCGGKWTLVSNV